jgi:hypothetical protein
MLFWTFRLCQKSDHVSEIVTFCCLGDRKAQARLLVAVTVPEIFY